jgi:DNA polymerase-1
MFIILDGNNLAWAGYYGLERAMKPEDDAGRRHVAALGINATILGAIARAATPPGQPIDHTVSRVAICFDQGRPLRRREAYPAYQMGREGDPKFMANETTVLDAIAGFADMAARLLPVEILRGENTEADDLIAGLVDANPDRPKRIVSTDRDFLQLIGPMTSVYAPVKKLVIDEANFVEAAMPKTASGDSVVFPRERFLDYRALTGDPSDNLPGVSGIGPLSAAKLLAAAPLDTYFGDAAAVRAALARKSAAVEAAFASGTAQGIVRRNRELMDLRRPAPCWGQLDALTTRGPWPRAAFEAWLAEERRGAIDAKLLIERMDVLAGDVAG